MIREAETLIVVFSIIVSTIIFILEEGGFVSFFKELKEQIKKQLFSFIGLVIGLVTFFGGISGKEATMIVVPTFSIFKSGGITYIPLYLFGFVLTIIFLIMFIVNKK